MKSDFFDIVTNKDKLQKELIFYSLFLMVFENFVSQWKKTIRSFYSNGFALDEQTGEYYDFVKTRWIDGECITSRDKGREIKFNQEVFQLVKINGKNNPKLSMFRWMTNNNFIDENDYLVLDKCYSKRNEYAHGIDKCLNRFVTREEKELLLSLIEISKKASKNWIYEVELPTSTEFELKDFLDDEGNYKQPEVYTGTDLFYTLVLSNIKDIFDGKTENASH